MRARALKVAALGFLVAAVPALSLVAVFGVDDAAATTSMHRLPWCVGVRPLLECHAVEGQPLRGAVRDLAGVLGSLPKNGTVALRGWGLGTSFEYIPAPGFRGIDSFRLEGFGANATVVVSVGPAFDVSPVTFSDLRTAEGGRLDLARFGEHLLVNAEELCERIGCEYRVSGALRTLAREGRGLEWSDGSGAARHLGGHELDPVQFAVQPVVEGNQLYVPIRLTVEAMGFQSQYDPGTRSVTVFRLLPHLTSIPLTTSEVITGSRVPLSYFTMAHEEEGSTFLVYDQADALIEFPDGSSAPVAHPAPPGVGALTRFVSREPGRFLVGSTGGYLLEWSDHSGFRSLAGGGSVDLSVGAAVPLADLRSGYVNDLVGDPELGRYAFWDVQQHLLVAVDLEAGLARGLARPAAGPLRLGMQDGDVLFLREEGLERYSWETGEAVPSSCFSTLFHGLRPGGIQFVPGADRWVGLDAGGRNILELRLSFDDDPDGGCQVLRRTHTGDRTAWLNGFGSYGPGVSPHRVMVLDSDGFNLVHYDLGGAFEIVATRDLVGGSNLRWIAPTSLAQAGDSLFVMANLMHQVTRYSLATGTVERYVGTGAPERGPPATLPRGEMPIGYSVFLDTVDGELWVGDHYNRRILAVDSTTAREITPRQVDRIGGIMGFAVDFPFVYVADNVRGQVAKLDLEHRKFFHLAGAEDPPSAKDSETARRQAAGSPIPAVQGLAEVRFGLPTGVAVLPDGTVAVTDGYRHGLWIIDPEREEVRPASGFRTAATYHYGSLVGNVGMSALDLRLSSPWSIRYDTERDVLIVPSLFGRAVLLVSGDLLKTCQVVPDTRIDSPTSAGFLADGRFYIVDSSRHNVVIFEAPDLSCLRYFRPWV